MSHPFSLKYKDIVCSVNQRYFFFSQWSVGWTPIKYQSWTSYRNSHPLWNFHFDRTKSFCFSNPFLRHLLTKNHRCCSILLYPALLRHVLPCDLRFCVSRSFPLRSTSVFSHITFFLSSWPLLYQWLNPLFHSMDTQTSSFMSSYHITCLHLIDW